MRLETRKTRLGSTIERERERERETRALSPFFSLSLSLKIRVCVGAVTLLPRVDQFWYKYTYMEEMVENYAVARTIFERWMAPPRADRRSSLAYSRRREREREREKTSFLPRASSEAPSRAAMGAGRLGVARARVAL